MFIENGRNNKDDNWVSYTELGFVGWFVIYIRGGGSQFYVVKMTCFFFKQHYVLRKLNCNWIPILQCCCVNDGYCCVYNLLSTKKISWFNVGKIHIIKILLSCEEILITI